MNTSTEAELREQRLRTHRAVQQREARLLSRSLTAFVRAAWPVVRFEKPLIWNWHYDLIGERLTLAAQRKDRKQIYNVPPRTLKSTFCAVLFPAWVWTWSPGISWLFISYAKDLTYLHSVERRNLIQSEWYLDRWPSTELVEDQNQKGRYTNTVGGSMIATSVDSAVGGFGGEFIVVDDPNDPLQPESEVELKNAQEKVDTALASRADDPRSTVRIVIQQRTHQQDVTGHLLETQPEEWTHIRLPMEAEETETIRMPISGSVHTREPGELLFPQRFGPNEVAEMKRLYVRGHRVSAQLQQRPTSVEGEMLKRDWWRFWRPADTPAEAFAGDTVPLPKDLSFYLQSWDMSFKETKDGSYVVGQTWAKNGAPGVYLLDQLRARMDFPTTCRAVVSFAAKWPQAITKLIEDKANGPAVIAQLKKHVGGMIPITPKDSKEARAAAVSGTAEAGECYLPHPSIAPWVHDFIEECASFPTEGVPDDQVDAWSQALERLVGTGRKFSLDEYKKKLDQIGERSPPPVVSPLQPTSVLPLKS